MPADDRSERERRLAAALRANLQRRKQQARRRPGEHGDEPDKANEPGRDASESDPPSGKA
jgi:hypothetical protein